MFEDMITGLIRNADEEKANATYRRFARLQRELAKCDACTPAPLCSPWSPPPLTAGALIGSRLTSNPQVIAMLEKPKLRRASISPDDELRMARGSTHPAIRLPVVVYRLVLLFIFAIFAAVVVSLFGSMIGVPLALRTVLVFVLTWLVAQRLDLA